LGSPGRNPALFSVGWMNNSAWGDPFSQRRAQGKIRIRTELDEKAFKLRRNLEIFNIYRRVFTYIGRIRNIFEFGLT
jgi:hypothetical protein